MSSGISKKSADFIYKCSKCGIVPGLETMNELMRRLGNPQDELNIIHIAGTNGKGSVGAFISGVLMAYGKSVARYTSPAVFCELEQYSINKKNIEPHEFDECIAEVEEAVISMCTDGFNHATEFEAQTAVAFLYFAKKKCDYALIEVGMGGTLDATNIIKKPLLSVITKIGIDHIAFLGDTIEEIAHEKCGIIKDSVSVVSAAQDDGVKEIIQRTAEDKSAKLVFAQETKYKGFLENRQYFDYDNIEDIELSALGVYQLQNAALAIEAVKMIGFFDNDTIKKGLKEVMWQGRFEIIAKDPIFIIDGAHNKDGVCALMDSVDKYFNEKKIIYITGVFKDKAYNEIATISGMRAQKIYAITPPLSRGLLNTEYAKAFSEYNKNVYCTNIPDAVNECKKEKDAIIICFGSLSFLNDIKKEVENGKS